MADISDFLPSRQTAQVLFQSGLRRPLASNVVRAYVKAATQPGDLVLDPFCQDSGVVESALESSRRVIATNSSPLTAMSVQVEVNPPPKEELDAALVRLSNTLKLNTPLWRHLDGLYTTQCAACGGDVTASYFIWESERNQPTQVFYACKTCRIEGLHDAKEVDLRRLKDVELRGFHYSYVLGRLAGKGKKGTEFDRSLLELYTPRNLYALAVLLIKIETLFADTQLGLPFRLLMLNCLEAGSKLHTAPPGSQERPRRSLRIPKRFTEVNVWQTFEEAAARLKGWKAPVYVSDAADPKAVSLDHPATQQDEVEGSRAFVGQRTVRELASEIAPASVRLVLARPPGFELAYGALAYLWSGWLFGRAAAVRMRGRVWHRFPNWPWYADALGGSLRALAPTLRDQDGRLVFLYDARSSEHTEALLLAGGRAGFKAHSFVLGSELGSVRWQCRLTLGRDPEGRKTFVRSEAVVRAIQEAILDTITRFLGTWGEPVGEHRLRFAIWQRLSEEGLLGARVIEEDFTLSLPFVQEQVETTLNAQLSDGTLSIVPRKKDERLWCMSSMEFQNPISDRVEQAVRDLLNQGSAWDRDSLFEAVYRRFPGLLTPTAEFVEACLESYGRPLLADHYTLRDEDRSKGLAEERGLVVEALAALGERFGFRVQLDESPFSVRWSDSDGQGVWGFRWFPAALFGDAFAADVSSVSSPVLILPSRRVRLIGYRLAKSPHFEEGINRGGWRYLLTEHVWTLAGDEKVGMGEFVASLGLHPPIERDREQLTLL